LLHTCTGNRTPLIEKHLRDAAVQQSIHGINHTDLVSFGCGRK
jgi:hypothetical protein